MKKVLLVLLFSLFFICLNAQVDNVNPRRTDDNSSVNYNPMDKEKYFPLNYFQRGTGIWTEVNPNLPRVSYTGLDFINPDTGWAVGMYGAVIKTTNGGEKWTVSQTPTANILLKVSSYNGQTVIVTGWDGLILRSTDAGETFDSIPTGLPVDYDLWGVQMLNDTLGWICGRNQTLLKTTDGGLSWQSINAGLAQHYWSLNFLNEQFGMIACGGGKVLRTADGGESWQQYQAGDTRSLYSIDIIDSLHIAAVGSPFGKIVYSSDGGVNWVQRIDAGGTINHVQYINRDTGYAVNTNVLKTTNRGQSWQYMTSFGGLWWHIKLLDDGTSYTAGDGLSVYKSTGWQSHWENTIINNPFEDVSFITETTGIALSSTYGYKTTNSGETWFRAAMPAGVDLFFLDSLTGFLGNPQNLYKTTDGALNWYTVNGIPSGADNVTFINQTIGWATSSNNILKTTDSGENWVTQITLATGSFRVIHFVDSLYGWTTIVGKRPFKTTDGGITWIEQVNLNFFDSRAVYFKDHQIGFLVQSGELYKTSNGGISWDLDSLVMGFGFGKFSNFNDILFLSSARTYRSTNGGNTWIEFTELSQETINSLFLLNGGLGYAVGPLGLILRYYDSTYVPVELISFTAEADDQQVLLKWTTSTETNNKGFEIQRKQQSSSVWENIGFVEGNGTTVKYNNYTFTDYPNAAGLYSYRLKQIDYNGSYEYSREIEVELSIPDMFYLHQNYPNPFNSSTIIKYQIPEDQWVTLRIYDALGSEISKLVNEKKKAGSHFLHFTASNLSSGIYFYKLTTGKYSLTRKLVLIK